MSAVFAAGDVRSSPVKRVAAAVGDGSSAIREIHQFRALRQHETSAV
jgi:thioredoxin reductase (NADPH)